MIQQEIKDLPNYEIIGFYRLLSNYRRFYLNILPHFWKLKAKKAVCSNEFRQLILSTFNWYQEFLEPSF